MKTVIFEAEEWEAPAFESLQDDHELIVTEKPLNAKNVEDFGDAEIISTFIYSSLGQNILRELPRLRFVATRSTGFDHIDADHCEQHQIKVSNVPEYGDNTVAEHVFGLLSLISHHLFDAIDRTRKGDFSQTGLRGFDLSGKVLGVVGTGKIGEYVIRIARGYQMEVLAFDVKPRHDLAESLGFTYTDLDTLLSKSDVVTLHVPGTRKTDGLISRDQFACMKHGTVLINTARGRVVDAKALMEALADGTVAAAGLDVLPEEPAIREEAELLRSAFRQQHDLETLLANHLLLRQRNVFITPHSAFNTKEAVQRILDTTVENISAFCRDEPQNIVIQPGSHAAAGS